MYILKNPENIPFFFFFFASEAFSMDKIIYSITVKQNIITHEYGGFTLRPDNLLCLPVQSTKKP